MELVIVDYGMGNLRSVTNAFQALGCQAVISRDPLDLKNAERIVLPGVGAFGDGMRHLKEEGLVEVMQEEVIENKKPFLGICLGMQLLATKGTEHGEHQGLNWIPGSVVRIPGDDHLIRIPHIGWNGLHFLKKDGLYSGLTGREAFYFLHSYVLIPENDLVVSSICDYGTEFAASIEKENIFGVQFHPEKSQEAGLKVLKNFLSIRTYA